MAWFGSICLVVALSCVAVAAFENCADSDSERCKVMNKEKAAHPEPKGSVRSSGYPWERTSGYWINLGHQHVRDKVKRTLNTNRAKNVIFFLGDGMSIATLFATRMALGGEEVQLSFEKFPYTGLSKTYCVDAQVSDSACTGTAYMTGVKGNYLTIGVNAKVPFGDCKAGNDPFTHTHSIAEWALDAGKSAGIVTTTRVTHASPASTYAHVANRDWEDDFRVRQSGCNPHKVVDIARQLVHGPVGSRFSVILGGGRGNFRDATMPDEEGGFGYRNDSRNLIHEWLNSGQSKKEYVWNREGLLNLPSDTESVLGLFEKSHLQYYLETQDLGSQDTEPTLEEMTRTAIDVLKKNKDGYFLFVEGGRIDMAHHDLMARAAVWETIEFQRAIRTARDMTSEDDTLIVVTSDHSHTMTVNGYPTRGNDIFGEVDREPVLGTDSMPYMTLSYANGLMNKSPFVNGRENPDTKDYTKWSSKFPFYVPIEVEETHGGDDVGVFASGPYAHLFTGTMEQSFLPHLMAYAASIGDGPKRP